jgi:hypothetical protein
MVNSKIFGLVSHIELSKIGGPYCSSLLTIDINQCEIFELFTAKILSKTSKSLLSFTIHYPLFTIDH